MTVFTLFSSLSASAAGQWDRMEADSGGDDPHCTKCGYGGKASESSENGESTNLSKREENVSGSVNNDSNDACSIPNEKWRNKRRHQWTLSNLVIMIISMIQWLLVINIVFVVMSPSLVSAIDLNPHGGSYQREGGRNEFYSAIAASAQQQSDYGDDMVNDMIMTCSRPTKSSRAARYLAIKKLDIPCDMGDKKSAWCNLPGDKYPWHAVRRFVFENQGLMRRMYGEVRQLSLLRMEFEDDMDDELEEERRGPPRGPPFPEDHRRNSILTEVLDESLPRILSDTPPGDQILLRDHNVARSTPRSLSTTSAVPIVDTSATPFTATTSAATTTPMMISTSSEEQLNGTEVIMSVTVETISPGEGNATTIITTQTGETDTASTPGITASTSMARNGLLEEVVTEEATQSTGAITETEKEVTSADGETTITTTEEMFLVNGLNEQIGGMEVGSEQFSQLGVASQQLNDGLLDNLGGATGSMGSDETHDFLNLDKNHIVYFDDVGKNRRPAAGGSDTGGGEVDLPPQPQPQGKLKAVNACPVKEEVVAPYWANNTRGEILALLNLYPFEQYIHWERCNHENKQMFCRQGCRCEQQYRLHRLLAYDPVNDCRGIFSDWFRFPSCCVCRCYLNEYELMMLNAAGQEPNANPSSAAKSSKSSDRIRSPRKLILDQLVDGPDVHGLDAGIAYYNTHFFYKQGYENAQPRK